MDCSRNQALVSWNVSEGALSYKVTAQNIQGAISSCESTDIKCTLTNLTCGQSYSVQVVAQDNICSSLPSPALIFNSGRVTEITEVYLNVTLFTSECDSQALWFFAPSLSSLQTQHWLSDSRLLHQLGPLELVLCWGCPELHLNSPVLKRPCFHLQLHFHQLWARETAMRPDL